MGTMFTVAEGKHCTVVTSCINVLLHRVMRERSDDSPLVRELESTSYVQRLSLEDIAQRDAALARRIHEALLTAAEEAPDPKDLHGLPTEVVMWYVPCVKALAEFLRANLDAEYFRSQAE